MNEENKIPHLLPPIVFTTCIDPYSPLSKIPHGDKIIKFKFPEYKKCLLNVPKSQNSIHNEQ